jgi:hypothetical protein
LGVRVFPESPILSEGCRYSVTLFYLRGYTGATDFKLQNNFKYYAKCTTMNR